jgi:hypothetical protein
MWLRGGDLLCAVRSAGVGGSINTGTRLAFGHG